MAVVDVEFIATANFSALIAQANAANASLAKLQATTAAGGAEKMAAAFSQFTSSLTNSGRFTSQMVNVQNSTNAFGKSLMAGKLTMAEYRRELAAYVMQREGMIDKLAAQNVRMAQSTVISRGINPATGQMMAQVLTSQGALANTAANQAAFAAQRMGVLNKMLIEGSHSLINWGKNTQWAGRQMMVGLSMPLLVIGSLAAKTFFDFDKELTRMVKVYGNGLSELTKQQADAMKAQARQTSFELAKMYGTPIKQTAELFGTIAQAGYEGADLVKNVELTTQLATLGSVDSQQAWQSVLTLQNAFRISTDDLQGSLDFLNATENSTVLSLQDVTAAIPRAAPAVRALGGDVKDLAAYLVAMREGGVPAAEAANAIKSSLASLINPTRKTRDVLNGFGIDLKQIVRKNAGDLTGTILAVQKAFDQLDPLQRTQAIAQAFGKFQFSKITALLNNLGKEGSQTQKVFELMNFTVGELAVLREREVTRLQNTASGKFRRAWGDITTTLAKFGEKFLNTATEVVKVVGKVFSLFEKLPGGVKSFLGGLTLFAAFVGPIVMLTGVLANFVGYISMGLVRIKSLASGSKGAWTMLTPEMIAAEKASEILDTAIMKQTDNIEVLTGAIGQLITKLSELAGAGKAASTALVSPLATPAGNAVAAQMAAMAQARMLSGVSNPVSAGMLGAQRGVYGHTFNESTIASLGYRGKPTAKNPQGALMTGIQGTGVYQASAHNEGIMKQGVQLNPSGSLIGNNALLTSQGGLPASFLAEQRAGIKAYLVMEEKGFKISSAQRTQLLTLLATEDGAKLNQIELLMKSFGMSQQQAMNFYTTFLDETTKLAQIEFNRMESLLGMTSEESTIELKSVTERAKAAYLKVSGNTKTSWQRYLNSITVGAEEIGGTVQQVNANIIAGLETYHAKFKTGLFNTERGTANHISIFGSRLLAILETGALGIAEYNSILAKAHGNITQLTVDEAAKLRMVTDAIIVDTAERFGVNTAAADNVMTAMLSVSEAFDNDLYKKDIILRGLASQINADSAKTMARIIQPGGAGTAMTPYASLSAADKAKFDNEMLRLTSELGKNNAALVALTEALGLDIEALGINTQSNKEETASNRVSKVSTDTNNAELADNTAVTQKLSADTTRLATTEEIALMRGGAAGPGGTYLMPGAGRVGGGMGLMGVGMGLTVGSMFAKGGTQHGLMTAGMMAMMLPMLLQMPGMSKLSQLVGSTGVLGKKALVSSTAMRAESAALKAGLPAGLAAQKGEALGAQAAMRTAAASTAVRGAATAGAAATAEGLAAAGPAAATAALANPIGLVVLGILSTVIAIKGVTTAMNNATKATNSYVGASNKLVQMLEGTTSQKGFEVTRRPGETVSESKSGVQSARNVLSQLPEGDIIKDVIKDIQSGEDKYGFWGPMKRLLNFKREMNAQMSIPIKMQTIYANMINSGVEEQKARDYIQGILEEAGQERYSADVSIALSNINVSNPEAVAQAILTNPLTQANKDFADALANAQPEFTAASNQLSDFFKKNYDSVKNQIRDYYQAQGYQGDNLKMIVDQTLKNIQDDINNHRPLDLSQFVGAGSVPVDSPLASLAEKADVVGQKFVELSDKVNLLHGDQFNEYVQGVANYVTSLQDVEGTDAWQKQHDALVNNIALQQQYNDDAATFQQVFLKDIGLTDEKYKDVLASAANLNQFMDATTLAAHGIAPELVKAAIAANSLPEVISVVVKMDVAYDKAIAGAKENVNFDKMVKHTGGGGSGGGGGDPYAGQKEANQKKIDQEKKIISQIEKKREAEKKAFEEKKRQNDYLSKQADQQIKYREALAIGDFGAAALAKNQMIADQNAKAIDDEQKRKDDAYQREIDKHQGIIDRQEEINKGLDKLSQKAAKAQQDIIDTHDENVKTAEDMWDRTVKDSRNKYYANATAMQADNKTTNDKLVELGIDQKAYWESAYRANKAGLEAEIKAGGKLVEAARAEIQKQQMNIAQVAELAVWIESESKDGTPPTSEEINKKIFQLAHPYIAPASHGGGAIYDGMPSNRMGKSLRGPISSDEMYILAQRGEYMINASAAGIIGRKNLDALNNGKVPAVPVSTGGGGSNYNFTVNAAPGQDPKQIAQEVHRIFQINERRKGGPRR